MSRVTVRLKNGRAFSATTEIPKGDPRNPMSPEELYGKFKAVAEPLLGAGKTRRLYEIIMNDLQNLQNLPELTDMVIP
jgi:2-methylcitrate dehydratase